MGIETLTKSSRELVEEAIRAQKIIKQVPIEHINHQENYRVTLENISDAYYMCFECRGVIKANEGFTVAKRSLANAAIEPEISAFHYSHFQNSS